MKQFQSKQIWYLREQLEKRGWKIVQEEERTFSGKPKWELKDDIPHLIFSWTLKRNTIDSERIIDFIAWGDSFSYETFVNDCSHCELRKSDIRLEFKKDKTDQQWQNEVKNFIEQLF